MFIRQVKKQRSKDSKVFYQYTLAQTSRIDGKVKQRSILYLGSDRLLDDKEKRRQVLQVLKSLIFKQNELFPLQVSDEVRQLAEKYYQKYLIRYPDEQHNPTSIPPKPQEAEFHNVDIKTLDAIDVKEFGNEYLCKQVLDRIDLRSHLSELGFSRQKIDQALISIIAKAIYASSEYKTAQILQMNSSLMELFKYDKAISHKQLYVISDMLYEHKQTIDAYLYNRISNIFDIRDKLVIFDISNTYFETSKRHSKLADYNRSKEKRNDMPLVVFTGVINEHGFIRHSKIYEGKTPDAACMEDMLKGLESHTDQSHITQDIVPTVVIDAGIATEENLNLIKSKGYNYVCVSRKHLPDYLLEKNDTKQIRLTDRGNNEVEIQIFHPPQYDDTWMYVQSSAKRVKEQSMKDKLRQRFEEELMSIKNALTKKWGTKNINKVWERIGRAKQKHQRISSRYTIEVEQKDNKAVSIKWEYTENKQHEDKSKGVYFIRTNIENIDESRLWDIYNTIREVESTFRSLKTDLKLRPIYHQTDQRVEAHLYLTILAYQLITTIRHYLKQHDIHYDWQNIRRIMSTQKIQTIKFLTDKKQIHIRKPSVPIKEVKQIYDATNCEQIQSVIKKYVVYH